MTSNFGAVASERLVDGMRFRQVFRQIPAPVAVLLVATEQGGVTGITCTSASSLSGEPPMVMVAVDDKTGVAGLVEGAGRFSLNFLAADRERWARAFSSRGSELSALASVLVPGRTPVSTFATGTTAVLECRTADLQRGGDHWIVCGTVLHARFQSDVEPLVYLGGRYGTVAFDRAGQGEANNEVSPAEGNSP
ncbi:flavin reductase family protein [Qaidamihabitans albus]|uniref:flavin reductase family protein n=1 Tax=Qaidamihabitans albus TaxID=2795733 RepID=UPI0018F171C6|nr:flavin reductase family protein [Qaidamihabitans albus]